VRRLLPPGHLLCHQKGGRGLDTIYPTDIGCYTLGFLPPLSMGDFVICMGSSVSSACGFSKATDQKVIALIGDSTFFHSGITGLVNACIQQPQFHPGHPGKRHHRHDRPPAAPGVDMQALGLADQGRVSIEALVRAIGVKKSR
jgi:indolepyruvate ferredoxin oxidoreductase, alpha subunit